MTRRFAIRAALIATPFLAFVLYAALNWYEIEEKKVRSGMGEEAERDPYLAFTRLLARMGARTEVTRSPARLARPPEGGILLLGSRRLAFMTQPRLRELDAWVHRGGTLVALAEPPGIDDPLLERFGIERETASRGRGARRPAPEQAPEPPADAKPERGKPRKATRQLVASVPWPGVERALRVRMLGPGLRLTGEAEPEGLATASLDGQLMMAAFPAGRGRIVALGDFSFLGNHAIGELDHAQFAWRLATGAPDERPALVFLRVDSPSLGEWLRENAWTVMVAALLLAAAWLARIVPRFGPLEPEPPPERRSLLEHLRASGRYVWSRGEARALIDAVRERVWRTALRRRGGLKGAAHAKAQAALATLAGRPPDTVREAMQGAASSPAAFVATARALQELEAGLAHRSRKPDRPPKETPR